MKLQQIAANETLVTFPNYSEVLFSYKTPVAGYHPDLGYVRTNKWYSSTTTKHINKYIYASHHGKTLTFTCKEVDQEVIDNLVVPS